MNRMIKLVMGSIVLVFIIMNTGCVSYLSYQASKEEIFKQRVLASGNAAARNAIDNGATAKSAIKLIPLGRDGKIDGAMVGIDLLDVDAWTVVKQHPWRSLGAAAVDGGIVYGLNELINAIHDDNDSGDSSAGGNGGNTSGGDTVVVNGNGNTVNVGTSSAESVEDSHDTNP